VVKVIDASRIEGRGTSLDAVHDVALRQEQFGQIRAVLARDAGYQRNFLCHLCLAALGFASGGVERAVFSTRSKKILPGRKAREDRGAGEPHWRHVCK
jgi:hypothetical protein